MIVKRNLLRITIAILILTSLFLSLNIDSVLAQKDSNNGITVTINTSNGEIKYDKPLIIQGVVYNTTTYEPTRATIVIQILKDNTVLYTATTVSSLPDGKYQDQGYCVCQTGTLQITVLATSQGYNASASTTVVSEYYKTIFDLLIVYLIPFILLSASVIVFVIAIVSQTAAKKNKHVKQLGLDSGKVFVAIMFVLLSLLTASIVAFFLFVPSQIGASSPIGLVVNSNGNETQWVVNLGGQRTIESSQYLGGIQIPVYVLVMSFLGAYVFFLTKIRTLLEIPNGNDLTKQSLEYLARFFIAPLLAIALFLVLWQLEVRGTFILGAVSFATGLIIELVTDKILEFAKNVIGVKETPKTNIITKKP